MSENELIIFKIISTSGDARGNAFDALRLAREGKFLEADDKLNESKNKSIEAHSAQTQLITDEINGKKNELSLLMVHAQDHLMTSLLARDLIEEMIEMLRERKM